ncbi:phospholipase carboxylesterase [Leptolyngbya sp. Heron Island J]|uniref:alpha/beta hydrolase n=1 Tax=Leptolyngbya sp. Heron Island J TaxID=1385935 RepID=UPI0003B9C66D|nr:phospholipase/carboxylesterase [Leptolyngbya sp. Heron Island J]ESA34349.1 phospholipase carboxylesterase [Leptolyngbya sp. Heron Island J]
MSLQAISAGDSTASHLLILLHGWGANAQDVAGIAPYMQLANYTMLFPNAPHPHQVASGMGAPGGRMWYALPDIFDFDQPFTHQPDLQQSRQLLLDWLTALPSKTGIPLEKTVLGGFSQGGAMALDVGMQLPLAGMMALSGYNHGSLSTPISPRPILLVHGRQDPVVPITQALQNKTGLDQLSVDVDYHEFMMGHEISLQVLEVAKKFCEKLCKN